MKGLEKVADPSRVASVASFFVSRVDTAVDAALDADGTAEALALRGRAAVANAKLAYSRFEELFGGAAFAPLAERGGSGPAAVVGKHQQQEPELQGRDLRRGAHRFRHRQHPAGRDSGGIP